MRGGSGEAASSIGVLLSIDSTECSTMRGNGREHRAEEKICQYNSLDGNQRRREAGIHQWRRVEMSDEHASTDGYASP
jgi:hypothetical protein